MKYLVLFFCLFSLVEANSQSLYFPPKASNTWDTISPSSLGWCNDKIDTLYNFLQQQNSKAFIVLKDGKIVLEKYFGTFTKDSAWYWASAAKSLTSFLIGQAQQEKYLSINDSSSKYLGKGWTNCTPAQEGKIKIWNQLTMTSGLDDGVPDNHCTLDTCLNYLADAGTRWAYHTGVYALLEKVIENATSTNINTFTTQKVKLPTGMTGVWSTVDYDNLFISKARSMARYGLLILNKGIWNQDTLLHDTAYFRQMLNTSQQFNKSYGYLWWLNGKESYMAPGFQIVIPGAYAPDAPADMFSGIGKNGQIVSISPSKGLVVVRMGDKPGSQGSEVSTVFCNQIWQKINALNCSTSISSKANSNNIIKIYPNPAQSKINISSDKVIRHISFFNLLGEEILHLNPNKTNSSIDIKHFPNGIYLIKTTTEQGITLTRIIKN